MTSKEALENIRDYHNETVYDIDNIYTENMFEKELDIIEKDLDRLEEYRKIEKELGIDLITLFKALKNGFYHIDKNKHIYKTKRTKGNGGAMSYYASYYEIIAEDAFDDQYFYKLKDYGKVWALTKKELKENGR